MSNNISATELASHPSPGNCWIAVNGEVYDLSTFAPNHPGGADIIYSWAGQDASSLYNAYHSPGLIKNEISSSDKKGPFDSSGASEEWLRSQAALEAATGKSTGDLSPQAKPPLSSLINLHDFEKAFAAFGSEKANAYIACGSNDLLTHNANLSHWSKVWFRPHVMRNVSRAHTASTIFGQKLAMPVWICPMGVAKTAGTAGEAALGKGAAESGLIHCMSTSSSMTPEEILDSAPGHPWLFQLYVDKDHTKTESLLRRIAQRPQVKAIFVTADLPVISKREADERVLIRAAGGQMIAKGLAKTTGSFIDESLSWDDIPWIRKHTSLPVLVKGIQGVADARKAMQMGCAGIVVSNHGGRALDSAPSAVMVLLELRRDCPEVFERMDVFVDGGVRRGSDVLKAICLGATAVGVGRPFQCAVGYGSEGVVHCANILKDELETAMRLAGVTDINDVRGDMSLLNTSELETLLPPRREKYRRLQLGAGRRASRL